MIANIHLSRPYKKLITHQKTRLDPSIKITTGSRFEVVSGCDHALQHSGSAILKKLI